MECVFSFQFKQFFDSYIWLMFNKVNDLEMSVLLTLFWNILKHKTKWLVIVTIFRRTVGGNIWCVFREKPLSILFLRRCVPVGPKSCVVKNWNKIRMSLFQVGYLLLDLWFIFLQHIAISRYNHRLRKFHRVHRIGERAQDHEVRCEEGSH